MAREHEDNDVPYRSPVAIGVAPIATDEDEADISTIGNLLRIISESEARCSDMSTLDPKHPHLSMEQQMAAYKFALDEVILPLKTLCESTIGDVRLKQEENK